MGSCEGQANLLKLECAVDAKFCVSNLAPATQTGRRRVCHATERLHDNLESQVLTSRLFRAWLSFGENRSECRYMSDPNFPDPALRQATNPSLYEWRVTQALVARRSTRYAA